MMTSLLFGDVRPGGYGAVTSESVPFILFPKTRMLYDEHPSGRLSIHDLRSTTTIEREPHKGRKKRSITLERKLVRLSGTVI